MVLHNSLIAALVLLPQQLQVILATRLTSTSEQSRSIDPSAAQPYVDRTHAYLQDAKEALSAVHKYETLIKEIVDRDAAVQADGSGSGSAGSDGSLSLTADTTSHLNSELDRIHLKTWVAAVNGVDKILSNKKPAEAAAAAGKARGKFAKAVGDYEKSKSAYEGEAGGYAGRAVKARDLAHQVQALSNQARIEGDNTLADEYSQQADLLMNQAEHFSKVAKEYSAMSYKIAAVIPQLKTEENQAADRAAWEVDPQRSIPPEEAYRFVAVEV